MKKDTSGAKNSQLPTNSFVFLAMNYNKANKCILIFENKVSNQQQTDSCSISRVSMRKTEKLDELLVKFWFSCHTKKKSICQWQHLQTSGIPSIKNCRGMDVIFFDITRDQKLIKSQEAFNDATWEHPWHTR